MRVVGHMRRKAVSIKWERWQRLCQVGALIALTCSPAHAQHDASHEAAASEFEIFVAGEGLVGSGQPHPRDDDSWFNADVIAALAHDKFRAFGEYFITPYEHEFERLQFGYEVVPDTMVWLGRFHQPASAWNTEHHHGRYLQTAITRPSIEDWEDEEGLIPQHITGALIESRQPLGAESGLQLSGGVGAAPALTNDGYEPIQPIDENSGKFGLSYSARIAYLPDFTGTSSAGLLYTRDQMYVRRPGAIALLRSAHVALSVYGAYADWNVDKWRYIGAAYYVDVGLDSPNNDESFISGYLQVERQLPHRLTAFARLEDSSRMQESRYVSLFNDHTGDFDVTQRRAGFGLRWDYARRQALTCEFDHVDTLNRNAYEARFQWSAAIP